MPISLAELVQKARSNPELMRDGLFYQPVSVAGGTQARQAYDPATGLEVGGPQHAWNNQFMGWTGTNYAAPGEIPDADGKSGNIRWSETAPAGKGWAKMNHGSDFMDPMLAALLTATGVSAGAGLAGYGSMAEAAPSLAQSIGTSAATNAATAAAGGSVSPQSFYDATDAIDSDAGFGMTAPSPNYSIPGYGDVYGDVYGKVGTTATLASLIDRFSKSNGGKTDPSLSQLLGAIAPAALGAMGASAQADAQKEMFNTFMGVGAPSRARYEASYKPGFTMNDDPGFKDALDLSTRSFTNANSVGTGMGGVGTAGPNAWSQTMSDVFGKFAYPALQNYRNQNASTGGFGAFNTAAPGAAAGAANAEGNVFNALSYGAEKVHDIFTPKKKSLSDILMERF